MSQKCNNNKLRMYVKRKSSKDQLICAQWVGEGSDNYYSCVFILITKCTDSLWLGPARAVKESQREGGERDGFEIRLEAAAVAADCSHFHLVYLTMLQNWNIFLSHSSSRSRTLSLSLAPSLHNCRAKTSQAN